MRQARPWRSWASPAAASPPPGAASSASNSRDPAKSASQAEDVTRLDRAREARLRRAIQYVFQDPFASLDPRLTIGFSIAEPIRTHRLLRGAAIEDRVHELLQQVGLPPDYAPISARTSGGQRQRVCIARALASEPRLIIADEAVAALDVSIRAQVVNLLMELQARLGVAYLFISHDMAVVERIAHRVAVMYLGQIVEIGPRQAVFGEPQHAYTRRLLAAVPVADPRRRGRSRSSTTVKCQARCVGPTIPHRGAAGGGRRGPFRRPPPRRRPVLTRKFLRRTSMLPRILLASSLALGAAPAHAAKDLVVGVPDNLPGSIPPT